MTTAKSVPQQVMQRAAIAAWATRLGPITPEALAERDELSTATAKERLDEAVRLGLLDEQSILVGYSALYGVTAAGRTLARKHANAGEYTYPKGLRTPRVSIKEARHTIACASVVGALERRYPGHRVIGESELHQDEREQKRRLATVDIRRPGWRRSHSPDIVMWPPGEPPPLPVAVEVELTNKSREELEANFRAWARCSYIEAALYFAETTKIEERLLDVIERLKAEEMIVVNPLSEIIGPLPGFELPEWQKPTTDP